MKENNIEQQPKKVRANQGLRGKITDAEMEIFVRANGGLCARTAKEIQKKLGVPFTRQEVRRWLDLHPDIATDVLEEVIDIAEEGLQGLIRTGTPQVKLRAIELFLKTQGKKRGYVERTETEFFTNNKINLVIE